LRIEELSAVFAFHRLNQDRLRTKWALFGVASSRISGETILLRGIRHFVSFNIVEEHRLSERNISG